MKAFYEPDDEFIVDSAMVELIAVKLAVSHAKFYVKIHPEDCNKPLHVFIDNTSMWSNRFAGGSAPPLKPPLRKMMDVVLASICGALTQGMFGGQVWLFHKSMYGLSNTWCPDKLARLAADGEEQAWHPVDAPFELDARKLVMNKHSLLLQMMLFKHY